MTDEFQPWKGCRKTQRRTKKHVNDYICFIHKYYELKRIQKNSNKIELKWFRLFRYALIDQIKEKMRFGTKKMQWELT